MKLINRTYTYFFLLTFKPIGEGFIDLSNITFNTIAIKFLVLGITAPLVAIYMLYKDTPEESPTKADIFITMLMSMVFVWLGYEISKGFNIPEGVTLTLCFFLGIMALPLAIKIKVEIILAVSKLIDVVVKAFNNFVDKFSK
ncbi:MAG: hypothetical protein CL596_04835 [Alteromonas sp.]|nr:hypothetical protein [Alteromonas sp.]|tara:strand:+ start:8364 stop:8789 length:426 start_codon:yes stop_codon:yes gene_type:complete